MCSTSLGGVSYPNLLLVFSEPVIFRNLYHIFSQVLDFLWVFFYFYRIFLYLIFGLACDHGNSFLCLEEYEREGYWIEVRTVFDVKTITTTATTPSYPRTPRTTRLVVLGMTIASNGGQRTIQIDI